MSGVEVSSVPEVYDSPTEECWIVNVVLRVPASSSFEALGAVADTLAKGQR